MKRSKPLQHQAVREPKGVSVPTISLPALYPPRYDGHTPSTTSRSGPLTNTSRTGPLTNTSRTARLPIPSTAIPSAAVDNDDDDDGQVVSLSSIKKSATQAPQFTPKPRQISVPHPPRAATLTQRGPHLLNSADILTLAETDETTDPAEPAPPSTDTSQILFGHTDDEPDLSDL
jgi:hypothetical protein